MKSQNKYIGDDKFVKMLEHYNCPAPINVVKMRFFGAICSPNMELRPTDVISSFWEEGQTPRLETKDEAELFFKFFMGLWDDCFEKVKNNKVSLPLHRFKGKEELKELCHARYEEIEAGFAEGFWGGCEDLKIPAYIAEIIDSISEVGGIYNMLIKKLDNGANVDEIAETVKHSDAMVEKAISFIIENSVMPRIDSLKREVK